MENNITITIAGNTASGKSTLMDVIHTDLKRQGFDVKLDLEDSDFANESEFHKQMAMHCAERLHVIKYDKKTKITLKESQLKQYVCKNKDCQCKG